MPDEEEESGCFDCFCCLVYDYKNKQMDNFISSDLQDWPQISELWLKLNIFILTQIVAYCFLPKCDGSKVLLY